MTGKILLFAIGLIHLNLGIYIKIYSLAKVYGSPLRLVVIGSINLIFMITWRSNQQ